MASLDTIVIAVVRRFLKLIFIAVNAASMPKAMLERFITIAAKVIVKLITKLIIVRNLFGHFWEE